tara:strand:+ start:357 stop:458 length:102 start_codon:yes stop_codon:yes gene_type:complete
VKEKRDQGKREREKRNGKSKKTESDEKTDNRER